MASRHVYDRCSDLAIEAATREVMFWSALVEAFDAGDLGVREAATLIARAQVWTRDRRTPDRATVYRLVERWRARVGEYRSPGHGG